MTLVVVALARLLLTAGSVRSRSVEGQLLHPNRDLVRNGAAGED